jgi:hypothetical protein
VLIASSWIFLFTAAMTAWRARIVRGHGIRKVDNSMSSQLEAVKNHSPYDLAVCMQYGPTDVNYYPALAEFERRKYEAQKKVNEAQIEAANAAKEAADAAQKTAEYTRQNARYMLWSVIASLVLALFSKF